MESKKSPQADLEKKISMFFMIGIALSLLFVLMVFQYRQEISESISKNPVPIADDGIVIPITVTPVKELEKPKGIEPEPKINENLPPEVVDEPNQKLELSKLFDPGDNPDDGVKDIPLEPEPEVETVPFVLIEKMARPMECEQMTSLDEQKACFNTWIQNYINQNTKYPEIGIRFRQEDRVYVTFVISEKGEVESAVVERGQYEALNLEALRVIKAMPTFVPGTQRQKPVKMKMTIPVNFKLSR